MKRKEKKKKRAAEKSEAAVKKNNGTGQLRIRMYNVGFGDSFLVFVPFEGRVLKMLFDCGSIKQGEKPIRDIVNRIAP
jgi:hypothetical protein